MGETLNFRGCRWTLTATVTWVSTHQIETPTLIALHAHLLSHLHVLALAFMNLCTASSRVELIPRSAWRHRDPEGSLPLS
eukprot:5290473-Pleurochrysis_carterae.AAC.3